MKSTSLLTLFVIGLLFVASCGASYGSPDGAVQIYVTAIRDGNREKEIESLSRKDREEYKARNSKKARRVDLPASLDTADIEYGRPVMNDDGSASVTVTAKLQSGKGTSKKTVVVINEDGQWKVSIDKTRELQRETTSGGPREFRDGKEAD